MPNARQLATWPPACSITSQSHHPRRGDLYVLRRTAEFDITWLVIDSDGDRVCVVGVDDHPLAGSHDSGRDVMQGASVARTDLDVWISTTELESGLRLTAVSDAFLSEVDTRRAANAAGRRPTLLEEAVDGEPDYLSWRATLAGARDLLLGDAHTDITEGDAHNGVGVGQERRAFPRTASRRERLLPSHRLAVPMLIAAALLIATGLGILQRIRSLEEQVQADHGHIAALESTRQRLEDELHAAREAGPVMSAEIGRLEDELLAARETGPAMSAEIGRLEDELAGVEKSLALAAKEQERLGSRIQRLLDTAVVANAPLLVLTRPPSTRTGQPDDIQTIELGDRSRWTLTLEVVDPEPYSAYRLEILRRGTTDVIQSTDGLVRLNGRFLRLDLPADLFEAGMYDTRIYGLRGEEVARLNEEYVIEIKRERTLPE